MGLQGSQEHADNRNKIVINFEGSTPEDFRADMINGKVVICASPQTWNNIKVVFHAGNVRLLGSDWQGYRERRDEWAILDLQQGTFKASVKLIV